MKCKLVAVVTCLALAGPVAAQVMISPTPSDDQTRPRRGVLTPEEQRRLDQREEQRQEEAGPLRPAPDYNQQRVYEGRASLSGTRAGKCPTSGSVRATVRGNIIDASLTFPIERDAIHGFISGTRFEAKGTFGYEVKGAVTEGGISGTAVKVAQVKPSPQKRVGVPLPFIPGPATSPAAPPPPIVQDCVYSISLSRVL
jgi:hypothetical protein